MDITNAINLLSDSFDTFSSSWSKAITVEDPSSAERIPLGFMVQGVTLSRMVAVIDGGLGSSSTWTIRFDTDAEGTGTEIVTGGTATSDQVSGSDVTTLDVAIIPPETFLWVETTALAGAVFTLSITLFGTLST